MALLLWQDLSSQAIPSRTFFFRGNPEGCISKTTLLGDYCISLRVLFGPLNSFFMSLRRPSEKILVACIVLDFLFHVLWKGILAFQFNVLDR